MPITHGPLGNLVRGKIEKPRARTIIMRPIDVECAERDKPWTKHLTSIPVRCNMVPAANRESDKNL